jgi:hypothetical protein
LSEGRPTKQTEEVVQKIANAIALGLADDEAASLAGVSDMTLTTWRRDPAFLGKIKNAVSTRLAMRLSRIESGANGWQGTAWLLERLYPTRFSKPEIQISLNNSFSQTVNALSITISKDEVREIEAQAAPVRELVKERFRQYRPCLGNGNGDGAKRTVEVEAKPVEPVTDLTPISSKAGSEKPEFWRQFCGSDERPVSKDVAIYAAATVVNEAVGRGLGNQAIVAFKNDPVTVSDVLAVIDRLCGGPAGWQMLQRKAGY